MFVEGLISITLWLGSKLADKGFDGIYEKATEKGFNKKFYKAVQEAIKVMTKKRPEVSRGDLEHFFKDPVAFEQLMKFLFADANLDREAINDRFATNELAADDIIEFIEILKTELRRNPDFVELLNDKELFLAVTGMKESIDELIKISRLSGEEITTLRRIITERYRSDFSLKQFKETYTRNVLSNFSQLNFIGLGIDLSVKRGRRKNLLSLYVRNTFEIVAEKEEHQPEFARIPNYVETLPFENLFDNLTNKVILGDPGSGKSSTVRYIICSILLNSKECFENPEIYSYIPFRIELRKYLSYKKDTRENLGKYLSVILTEEYGISNIDFENVRQILRNHKVIIFFDGLDEIFDIRDRIEVRNDIQNIHNVYPLLKSITTSRIIGYEEAPVDLGSYEKLRLNNFNSEQVEEYVTKWYLEEEENAAIREREIEDFLQKKKNVDAELISNPLLLSLIVILFRNNLKLPESKLEIYQSCTKTLIDKWDAVKELDIGLNYEVYRRKEVLIADLAYWQYLQMSKNSKRITYSRAKSHISQSIKKRLNKEDDYDLDNLAEKFMNYLHKRSIYFDNNFTHKTFLEYYTAYWIFSNYEKKNKVEDRNNIISKYISNSFWHIVLELLLNLIDKDQADNEIIDSIVDRNVSDKVNPKPLIFFADILSSLQNISKGKVKWLILKHIHKLIDEAKIVYPEPLDTAGDLDDSAPVVALFRSLNRLTGISSIQKIIIECFQELEGSFSDVTSNILLYGLYFEICNDSLGSPVEMKLPFGGDLLGKVIKENYYIRTLHEDFRGRDRVSRKELLKTILEEIELFGPKCCVEEVAFIFVSTYYNARVDALISLHLDAGSYHELQEDLQVLSQHGIKFSDVVKLLTRASSRITFIGMDNIETVLNSLGLESLGWQVKCILLIEIIYALEAITYHQVEPDYLTSWLSEKQDLSQIDGLLQSLEFKRNRVETDFLRVLRYFKIEEKEILDPLIARSGFKG